MMLRPLLTIIRIEDNFLHGTFGALLIQSKVFCVTLEPCEFQNQRNISCIPAGCYEMIRIVSPNHGTTYEIINVPGRDKILFHKGNEQDDTEGCVILGRKWGILGDNRAVLNSGQTFTNFLNRMDPYTAADLIIKEAWA